VDVDAGVLRYSRQAAALFGWDDATPTADLAAVLRAFVAEDRHAVLQAFALATDQGGIELEKRIRRAKDGALRWLHISGRLVSDDGGARRMAGLITDVTAWREAEDRRQQEDRLKHFGYLCRKVAHDYNNLLMVMGANLELLNERVPNGDDKATRYFNAAHEAVERGAAFNQQLMAFAGRLEFRSRPVHVLQLLRDAEPRLRDAAGDAVHLRIDAPAAPSTPLVATDPDHLMTAVLNLVRNARDAMPDGGTLVLSVASRHVDRARAEPGSTPGEYVVITVADTGTGIADAIMDRIFEPFFTTREAGTAKGLGLSQVYGFAKQSGGFATIAPNIPAGTAVSIHLPHSV
jgi:PAS domain S-box-containing protein